MLIMDDDVVMMMMSYSLKCEHPFLLLIISTFTFPQNKKEAPLPPPLLSTVQNCPPPPNSAPAHIFVPKMSFPKLESLSLMATNFDEFVPCTGHPLKSLLSALHCGSPQFVAMEEANGGVEWVQVESIEGQGLMSNIYRIIVSFRPHGNDGGGITAHFDAIFKVTTTKKLEVLRPMEIEAIKKTNGGYGIEMFRKVLFEMAELEANFYEKVLPRAPSELQTILPLCFGILRSPDEERIEEGFVLMEDLAPRGLMPDLYEGLNNKQIISAIIHLAKFHSFTMTLPEQILASFVTQYYGNLHGLEEEIRERVLDMGSTYFLCHEKSLVAFLNTHNSLKTNVHTKYGIRPVLCHGDFWSNNLFFTKNADASIGDEVCAIFDWQTCHLNTGLNDVLRLIFLGVNAKLREANMWEWLDLYFDTIQLECKRLGITPTVEYSPELRRQLYGEQRHFELTAAFLALPTLFPGSKTSEHQRNLQERLESLFEECRPEYDLLRGKTGDKFCNFI